MHKYNVPKIVAEIIRLKKQSSFKYNTNSEAIALTTVAIIIFQYFILDFEIIPVVYSILQIATY